MFRNVEITSEEEDEVIEKVAEKVHNYGMEIVAILMLESIKPLSYIGGQMGRLFLSPYLPFFGENIGLKGEKFFKIFEKHENVEKLIASLEKKAEEKPEKAGEKDQSAETEDASAKRGWRRFLPF